MAKRSESGPDVLDMAAGPVTEDLVLDLLSDVIDPELGVDIVNLGLVRGIEISAAGVLVRMILTTPGCPLGAYLTDEVTRCLAQLPGGPAVQVDLVQEPPWSPAMMTDEAKRLLGWSR